VASAAGVDAGLVMHYFGSKQELFRRVIDAAPVPEFCGPPGQAAEQILASLADRLATEPAASLTILRSMLTNPEAASAASTGIARYQTEMAQAIPAEDASLRAAIISAITIGGTPGIDASHAAFYLPGQELASGNIRAFATLSPAVRTDGAALWTLIRNLGSSVGISKAHDRKELGPAIELAAQFDRKIVVEQGVGRNKKPRELEVAVLGNDAPEASVVGEVVPIKEFYDYEAKYLSEGSDLIVPARLTKQETRQVREMAIRAFQACDCAGLARVDFLMEPGAGRGKTGRIYVNEINTLPGFTSISMYPRLWAATGVPYPQLIDRLIQLALERRADQDRNRYSL